MQPLAWRGAALPVALALTLLVSTSVVLAASDGDSPESGTRAEVRNAQPPREERPEVAARGRTIAGQEYVVRSSWGAGTLGDPTGRVLCVEVSFGDLPSGPPKGDRIASAEACFDPHHRELSSTASQLFVDPVTGKPTDVGSRFVFGVASDDVAAVRVRGPNGRRRGLEVLDVPETSAKIFAGSAAPSGPGRAEVVGVDAAGRAIASQPLKFAGHAKVEGVAATR